jgi:hypothetical protein
MAAFQLYLQSGKQRKVTGGQVRQEVWKGGGNNSYVVSLKNSLEKKEI